jgi:hypothetical protein
MPYRRTWRYWRSAAARPPPGSSRLVRAPPYRDLIGAGQVASQTMQTTRSGIPVKKVVVRGLVALLLTGMALVLGGDPAHAQMPAGCRVDIGIVYEENEYINFSGSKSCYDIAGTGVVNMVLQRHRFWGWEDLKRVTVSSPNWVYRDFYDCIGTGTHTYIARIAGTAGNPPGNWVEKASNQLTVNCP